MHSNDIAAVVVTYEPEDNIRENLSILAFQVGFVYVIDNGSSQMGWSHDLPENVKLIASKINLGLAMALNIGIAHAISDSYKWVATFDQDSTLDRDHFAKLLRDIVGINTDSIGIISCRYIDKATGYTKTFSSLSMNSGKKNFKIVRVTMTSGSLMNIRAIQRCGLFRDEMFIDQLDNEICLRYRKNGFLVLEHQNTFLMHSVGKNVEKTIGKIKLRPSNHSPLRRYYMSRNRIFLYKKYFLFDSYWLLEDLFAFFKEFVKIVVYEEEKQEKLKMTVRGLQDGYKGKLGKYDA